MHGGHGQHAIGTSNTQFKTGRHSKYLPSQLDALYREALTNPELLEMADHIALLEAHIQETLARASDGSPVPKWSDIKDLFNDLATSILTGDPVETNAKLALIFEHLEAGERWDTTWGQVTSTMEQLRKMTDTEVKRKRELNQMVPVERVVILMAAVGNAVKRNVSNPAEIQAVYRELAMLHGTDRVEGKPGIERLGPEIVDVTPRPTRTRIDSGRRVKPMKPLATDATS